MNKAGQRGCLGLWLLFCTASPSFAAPPAPGLEAYPPAIQLAGKDSRQQLLVTARSATGALRDVTREAAYRLADPGVAVISTCGVIQPAGSGRTTLEISLGNQRFSVPVTIEQGDQVLPIDFAEEIVPILTRAGCNSGGCHGKSNGRGGFQLSLFGYDPRSDYESIVKGSRGRRLFLSSPGNSLLLRKPLAELPHGGGRRLVSGEPEAERLQRWIATGAGWGGGPQLQRIEVTPAFRTMGHRAQQQVLVLAVYSDGSRRDVTRLTEFRSNDTAVATVEERGLLTTAAQTGETAIVCIYRGQVGVARILVPRQVPPGSETAIDWSRFPRSNFIDDHVLAKLKQFGVPPSPVVDDAGFLRRATLQLAGRLPTLEEAQQFLADADPAKRERLVDRLLQSGAHADFFAQKWGDILRNKLRKQAARFPGTVGFHRWIRSAIAENMPYDRFVEEIITATGSPAVNPPAQWYAEVRSLDRYVDDTAQVFLGVRIGCARCHNHPFERFSQNDYYGLAAFFARVGRKGGTGLKTERAAEETIFVQPAGEVRHPRTGQVVPPHGLDGPNVPIAEYDDPRHHLVEWMRRPENPYFARAFVNRMWAHFFSRGLLEPIDDIRATNPAVNEPLLNALAQEFIRSKFDMQHIVKLICTSTTYQLSSTATDDNLDDAFAYARFYPQRLSAEVLFDAINAATRSRARFAGMPEGTTATQLPHEDFTNEFLTVFGRPPRESACECERVAEPSLSQSLLLMNDAELLNKINNKAGVAGKLALDKRPTEEKVRELFLTTLSRPPSAVELKKALEHIQSENGAYTAYGDLLWVLVNMKEFLYVR